MKFGVRILELWDTIPARDRQTDGQTDRHVTVAKTRASITSRG